MTTTRGFRRLGAGCGALFAIALFAASGQSGHPNVVEIAALALFLPFLAYLCSLFREIEGQSGWLPATAFASGLAGITIKLLSIVPEIARNSAGHGTPLYQALDHMASAATVISLYPLAVMLAAVAVLSVRTRALPRWLAYGAGLTAVALAVNGSFIQANFVPALLLFLLWTLVTSVVLVRRTWRQPARVSQANPAPAA